MIGRIEIDNYRCFKRLDVPVRPLTVCIGENNTGKSTLISAIWAGHQPSARLQNHSFMGMGGPVNVNLHGHADPILMVVLPSQGPPMHCGGVPDTGAPPPLDPNTLPALVDWLLRRDRQRFFSFVDSVKSAIPGVQDIGVATPSADKRSLELVIERGHVVSAGHASAGVRLLLFFLALAWHPSPPKLLLLEEPENGIHPKRLAHVMELLRGVVEGAHAPHKTQVILTTHSPYLLDLVDPRKDQVLVFQRRDDGSCDATPVDEGGIAPFLDDFLLGEVWTNEGEDGLLGRTG